jgi:hypothetical protein
MRSKTRLKVITICLVAAVLLMATGQGFGWTYFNDGGTHNINYTINDRVQVQNEASGMPTTVNLLEGGRFGGPSTIVLQDSRLNIFGWSAWRVAAGDNGQVTMSSGSIADWFSASGNAQIIMSGGTVVGDLQAWGWDNSQVTMSGGSVSGALQAFDGGHITIVGSNFAVDGSPVGFGQYFASDFGGGVLTGTLDSGALLNNSFYISTDASITLIPEPATLLLLGLGAVIIRRKRS